MGEEESLYIFGGNVTHTTTFEVRLKVLKKNQNLKLLYDSAKPLMNIYLKNSKSTSSRDTCIFILT